MTSSLGWSLRFAAAWALAWSTAAWAQDFDTSAGNLIAVLRESPGANQPDEALRPIGKLRVKLTDGREIDIDTSWFHYLGDMHVRLVFDGERSMQTASPQDLERLHLDPQQALARAVENMRRLYGTPQATVMSGGLMQVTGRSPDLVSSYFLDREFWVAQLEKHPEGLVVSVPRRGGLLFASATDIAALTILQFTATAVYTASERSRVSSALYLFKDGRWSVYQAPQQMASADSQP